MYLLWKTFIETSVIRKGILRLTPSRFKTSKGFNYKLSDFLLLGFLFLLTYYFMSLQQLLNQLHLYISQSSTDEMEYKPSSDQWSKKEIMGHLVDSSINNLQRFTEIQFKEKPYAIRPYDQDALVQVNNYQKADKNELFQLLISLNQQISRIIEQQTPETLHYKVVLDGGKTVDLQFIIQDYISHFEHHVKQII